MTFRRGRTSGVLRFLPAQEHFEILDAAQHENRNGSNGADDEHALQEPRYQRYYQGHNLTMLSDMRE